MKVPAELDLGGLAWAATGLAVAGPVALAAAGVWVERTSGPFLHGRAEAVPPRPTAIVPGARVAADGTPSAVLEDRLRAARDLLEAGRVERILVSGCSRPDGSHDEAAGMRRWLLGQGVPDRLVDVDGQGHRTLRTMLRAADSGVDAAAICTQRFHLARSVFLARQVGIDAVGLAADRRLYRNRHRDAAREVLARYRAATDVLRRRVFPAPP